MTEEGKHAILFDATLLCARKWIETIESDKPNLAKQYFEDRTIQEAQFISARIGRNCELGRRGLSYSFQYHQTARHPGQHVAEGTGFGRR